MRHLCCGPAHRSVSSRLARANPIAPASAAAPQPVPRRPATIARPVPLRAGPELARATRSPRRARRGAPCATSREKKVIIARFYAVSRPVKSIPRVADGRCCRQR
eukprot:517514-Prymnesium_polylepis.1